MNVAGAVFTGDTFLFILSGFAKPLLASTGGLPGMILTVLLGRPAPLILLVMAIFYLWVYVQRARTLERGGPRLFRRTRKTG